MFPWNASYSRMLPACCLAEPFICFLLICGFMTLQLQVRSRNVKGVFPAKSAGAAELALQVPCFSPDLRQHCEWKLQAICYHKAGDVPVVQGVKPDDGLVSYIVDVMPVFRRERAIANNGQTADVLRKRCTVHCALQSIPAPNGYWQRQQGSTDQVQALATRFNI